MKKFISDFVRRYLSALIIIVSAVIVLINSSEAAEAVRKGITICLESVIPSLFPMIFLSQLLIKSGGADEIGRLLDKPTKILFGLPGVCGAAILTSLTGGFPAGARAAETLYQTHSISQKEGERLAMFAFCSGPGFTIGFVGAVLYGNKTVGVLILTAQVISSIIIGMLLNVFGGRSKKNNIQHIIASNKSLSEAFVESSADAASTVLAMSSFIVVFCVISSMISIVGINDALADASKIIGIGELGRVIIPSILEVTSGSMLSVTLGIPFTAFVAGFGGLSVHFQNFAICRTLKINKCCYIVLRLIQGVMCALIAELALKLPYFSNITADVFAPAVERKVEFSRISMSFGVIMLVMCFMCVMCLPSSDNAFIKRKGV